VTCALLLGLGCGESRRDAVRTAMSSGGVGGAGGAPSLGGRGGGGGADGGTDGAPAGAGGGSAGVSAASGNGGSSGSGAGGGNVGAAAGMAATAGTAGQVAVGGMGASGEAGTTGEGGDGGNPDLEDFDDLIVRSSLMQDYEGMTVYATFDHNIWENSRSDLRSDVVTDGSFELFWAQEFYRNSFGAYVTLFVDRHGDGLCTQGADPAWAAIANNHNERGTPEICEFKPEPEAGVITCEEFDTWFNEPVGT
jgi:hypothetical protein